MEESWDTIGFLTSNLPSADVNSLPLNITTWPSRKFVGLPIDRMVDLSMVFRMDKPEANDTIG